MGKGRGHEEVGALGDVFNLIRVRAWAPREPKVETTKVTTLMLSLIHI